MLTPRQAVSAQCSADTCFTLARTAIGLMHRVHAQYDAADWILMLASTAVFVWAAAAFYSLYAHLYYSMGFKTIADMLN